MARQTELRILLALASAALLGAQLTHVCAQSPGGSATLKEPLKQIVPSLELNQETILDGLAKLNQSTTGLGFSVELPLGQTISAQAPKLRSFEVVLPASTLGSVLDQLCHLDPTFAWQQSGSQINVFPRALEKDTRYLLNRKVEFLEFKYVPDAQAAVFQTVARLPAPKEQIAIMQSGAAVNFARPWTASFRDITVREAFNRIAQQIGTNYGWQFTGAADFRIVTFYARLGTTPRTSEARKALP